MDSFCDKWTSFCFLRSETFFHLFSVVLACCLSALFFMESISQSNFDTFPLFLELSFFPRMGLLVCLLPFLPWVARKYFHGDHDISCHLLILLGLIELDWRLDIFPTVCEAFFFFLWELSTFLNPERMPRIGGKEEFRWGKVQSLFKDFLCALSLSLSFWDLVKCPKPATTHCTWLEHDSQPHRRTLGA